MMVYLSATRSTQPQRRGRPVTEPYSFPLLRISSASASNSSVGKGPLPTRVQYALKIPNTSPMLCGEIPKPVQAPALTVFDEVTNGYVPKSMSNKEPCAPSANTLRPSLILLFTKCSLSTSLNVLSFSNPANHSSSIDSRSYSKSY